MKNTILIIFAVLMAACSCQKETISDPCNSTMKVVCWNHITNGWTFCPDPENPGQKIMTNHSTWVTTDTLSVCDTVSWLSTTRKKNEDWRTFGTPESIELKSLIPPVCGCY